jgi:RHS repeat-associated protein
MGTTLVWEKGRQLKQFGANTYTYNNDGIRTSKTVGGVKHTYVLDGTNIVKETWGSNTLIPLYDLDGTVCGINYNGTAYYFYKNLQGDVVAITNDAGVTVAKYTYDAWGKCTITSDISGANIATINPFRYRSYYYDNEVDLYYLQGRYYDAESGRFLNSDDPAVFNSTSDPVSIDTNKFCYCLSDPTNNVDEFGNIASTIVTMIKNFILGMGGGMLGLYLANITLNLAKGKKNFYDKNDTWGTYIAEGVKSGGFSIFGSKYIAKLGTVVAASALKQFIDMIIYKTPFNWSGFFVDILVGILFVTVIHFGPTVLSKLSKKQKKDSNKWLTKVKDIIKKIADHIISKLKKTIEKLVSFFKNVFVKRFSISYAKRIGSELKKIFL